ncbi:membrane protein, OMP85 family protein [Cyanobium sp. PCC 7001]|uniref:BamA/OMP85 family outer membrane protein n=1 Tax=Cyanobium sp. PCC 7001 TaxID=180281 RepID=UPI0001804B6E|nr:BamA/TamA family outer membrane protein [Cyanobium sp. PCC 7001]EDY39155.1 membrane protein, OMP85 family protein [Cyanobium sp. PCC 7001]
MVGSLGLKGVWPLLGVALLAGAPALAQESPAPDPSAESPPADQPAPVEQPDPAEPSEEPSEPADAPAPGSEAFPTPAPEATPDPGAFSAPEESAAPEEPRVQIAEIVVEGLDGHPEQERLELAAYDAMAVRPGTRVTRSELQTDLSAVYATGWFSDVRIQPVDGPLGVRLIVAVVPNPVLRQVSLEPADLKVPEQVVTDTFAPDYEKTLNLNTLQTRMQELQRWYADEGYSLARVTGPSRVSPDGTVELLVREGIVNGVEVQFLDKEGSATNDKGEPIRGKSKPWVVTREISMKPGDVFNRRKLEEDIRRLYGTGLFGDVKVTLRPVPAEPGQVVIVLGMVEQSTGSVSGGVGYSQNQGVFGQIQLQESNLLGRAWSLGTNFSYGQFGGLGDITFTDPWIKGDRFRTSFRTRVFFSREVPQIFQSENTETTFNGKDFDGADFDVVTNSPVNTSGPFSEVRTNFDSVAIQRIGANVQFVRPLNGGDPYKKAPWNLILAFGGQEVTPMNFSGTKYSQAVVGVDNDDRQPVRVPSENVICLAFNCASENQLLSFRVGATYSSLDDPRNPTRGNFFSIGSEQFLSVGNDSPTFNRVRSTFTHYIPVDWLKIYKGCRPKPGETRDCKQALAFQVSGGALIGDEIPPYEAFCLGGGNSVRGYADCDLGVGKVFGEFTAEYRFPLFSIVSGSVFFDAGTTFGTQGDIPGNPGGLLGKKGEGFSPGIGLIVTTPVGPLRLEVATEDFTDNWRFNLGVGWKF